MSVKAADLVAYVEAAYQEKGGYIWGTAGVLWTEKKQQEIQKGMLQLSAQKLCTHEA